MKIVVNTDKLKTMLSTVIKGVGNGKLIPITQYLKVELSDCGTLKITATNLNNYITVSQSGITGESGSFLVIAGSFVKLVSKTTKGEITISVVNNELKIKGNGEYTLPILAEDFPRYDFDMDNNDFTYKSVKTSVLKSTLAVNKYSVSNDMVMPCLTGYLVSNKCITTDGIKMCINNVDIFPTNILIPPSLVDLINTITDEEVEIYYMQNKLLFQTNTITIFGTELDGKDNYPDITSILNIEYPYNISVPKTSLLSVLDRLSIFTNPYDNNGIKFIFEGDQLKVTDLKGNNEEIIKYVTPIELNHFAIALNINFITDLIHAVQDINVNIHFGDSSTLRIDDNNVTEILGLMSTEESDD